MERRKVDILCVQETRWEGSKARSTGAGFKLFYYGVDSKRNGAGVVLKEEFVRNVLEVKRVSDRVMSLKLEIEGVMLKVVSGYAPQVGCELEKKERFWSELDEVMESISTGERVVIGADFNGHVGEENTRDGQSDVQSCSNYRGIKLMSHTMKLWERVVEARLRKVVEICEQQYGFMPRKSTTDAIFALRILMEKYRDGQRELHCVFVDLEKAYDRVPREELWYCMRKSGVAEKYVRVVQNMYERSRTVVRCAVGQTEEFKVEVGLHQGSALSPFLFAIVMDQLSEEVRQESPWTMMFADDMVICSESREQVEENLERWRFALERRGMKVSRSKTEYMCVNEREGSGTVRLQGEEVKKVQEFKYLGSTVQSNGECGKERRKNVSLTFDLDDKLPAEGPDWRESKTNRRRVPAAPCSHPPAPWGVPDPRKTDIIAPEPSFVGGRRSVRVLGGGRHSALLLGGGRRLALRLGCGRHSALLLGCGRRSAPPLRCGRRVGPFGLAVGQVHVVYDHLETISSSILPDGYPGFSRKKSSPLLNWIEDTWMRKISLYKMLL
ncbi:hypothetical protein QTP70_017369 [Hemibagrus guttatus]|uniref:ribonuclease H n=1 Tax=Hemibagrus guttatus TaxID=175788 RepID=A0AAE0RET6_9TELE|nr:hypothetical protein QTP70_017369 [Hemibagrus guttatus]